MWDWDFIFKIIQSIGTITLGIGAITIAFLKWKDDREKIKNENWQARFQIYQVAVQAKSEILVNSIANTKLPKSFIQLLHESRFVFGEDQEPYKMMEKIYYFYDHGKSLEKKLELSRNQEIKDKAINEINELMKELREMDPYEILKKFLVRKF